MPNGSDINRRIKKCWRNYALKDFLASIFFCAIFMIAWWKTRFYETRDYTKEKNRSGFEILLMNNTHTNWRTLNWRMYGVIEKEKELKYEESKIELNEDW